MKKKIVWNFSSTRRRSKYWIKKIKVLKTGKNSLKKHFSLVRHIGLLVVIVVRYNKTKKQNPKLSSPVPLNLKLKKNQITIFYHSV